MGGGCDGVQEGHDIGADSRVRCSDSGARYPERNQSGLLPDWLRALWPCGVPYLCLEVEDGQGDRRQEDGGSALLEVQRDGSVQLPAAATSGVRYLQELRGSLPCSLHGRQRSCHVGQSHLLRAQGGGRCWRQEEVSSPCLVRRFRDGLLSVAISVGSASHGVSRI